MKKRQELLKIIEEATAELEKLSAVESVFPIEQGYYITTFGIHHVDAADECALHAKCGNSFRTGEEARKEKAKREAKVRIIEAINIANEGDNGFKCNKNNYYMRFNHCAKSMEVLNLSTLQNVEQWEYIRTNPAAQEFINSKTFVEDWKLVKGIE